MGGGRLVWMVMDVGLQGCHRFWRGELCWSGYQLRYMEGKSGLMEGAGVGNNEGLSMQETPFMEIKAPLTAGEGTVFGKGGGTVPALSLIPHG